MNLRTPNSNDATRSVNRSRSVVPSSGLCSRCIDGCKGSCEVFQATFRGRELIYPGPYGNITAGGDKEYPIDYSPIFKQTTLRVGLPRRRASYMDYINAQKEVARLTAILPEKEAFAEFCKETFANEKLDGPGPYDSKLHHFVKIKNANAVINRYQDQDAKPSIHFDMNVARIGDIAIATNPFELYLYFGQIIKARSKAVQTFLVQLSAGADLPGGYLPSPDAEKFGGYGGLIINGQVGSDGGYKLVDTTVEAINQLFEE